MSLKKRSLGSDRILHKKDGHKRETTCPQIKWGRAYTVKDNKITRKQFFYDGER